MELPSLVQGQDLTLIPIAMAVFNLTSSPNLKEPSLLSLAKIKGTPLDEARFGRCLVSHRGLQSEATSTACITYIVNNVTTGYIKQSRTPSPEGGIHYFY